jgi:hypothetical protein
MAGLGTISASGLALRKAFSPQNVGATELRVGLPGLPVSSDGLRVAFLTDLHYGPDTPNETIINAVSLTQRAAPDLILLGGDYIQWSMDHLSGVIPILATLRAPLGVFGAMAAAISKNGLGILVTFGKYIGEFYFGLAILWGILLTVGYLILKNRLPVLLRRISSPMSIFFKKIFKIYFEFI